MHKFAEDMGEFLEYVRDLERKHDFAVFHLKGWLKSMSPKELECLCLDHVIEYDEVPEGLRTEYVQSRTEKGPKPDSATEKPAAEARVDGFESWVKALASVKTGYCVKPSGCQVIGSCNACKANTLNLVREAEDWATKAAK